MVKCQQCGNDFDEQYGVCPKCGWIYEAEEKLPEIKFPADTLPEIKDRSKEKPAAKKKSKAKIFVIIGVIAAVVIAGIIAGIIILTSGSDGTSEYDEQISLGEKYLKEENYDEAIAAFKKAIEIDPNDPEAYIGLADAYLAKGDKQNAVLALEAGYEKTGSEDIKKKLDSLKNGDAQEESSSEESSKEESSKEESSKEESSKEESSREETSREEYQDPEYTLGNIVASGSCGKSVKWELDENGLLVIRGNGMMNNYSNVWEVPWYEKQDSIKTIIIETGVTKIGKKAFLGCKNVTSVRIPDSVTTIGYGSFYDCLSLTSIAIPDSVTTIDYQAFQFCTNLTNVTLPKSITNIGAYMFSSCSKLTSITIPDSVTKIEDNAFSGCVMLTDITIPNSVRSIENEVFYGCESITSITLPDSITEIRNSAFSYCTGLASINIPNSVTYIGRNAFSYCTGLTNITIPESVTVIGSWAFDKWTASQTIYIKGKSSAPREWNNWNVDCEAKIVWNAEPDNTSKPETSKPETSKPESKPVEPTGVTLNKDSAVLTAGNTVRLSATVSPTNADDKSVTWSSSNTGVAVVSDGIVTAKSAGTAIITAKTSNGRTANCTVTVNEGTSLLGSGNCGADGSNVKWELDNDGVLVISGSGDMKDFMQWNDSPWYKKHELIKTIIIKEGVTSIGSDAFVGYSNLTSVTIPQSVTKIGKAAFYSCSSVAEITIPDSVASMGFRVFSDWRASQTIYIKGRSSAPEGWRDDWNDKCSAKIVWNA